MVNILRVGKISIILLVLEIPDIFGMNGSLHMKKKMRVPLRGHISRCIIRVSSKIETTEAETKISATPHNFNTNMVLKIQLRKWIYTYTLYFVHL